MIDKNLFQITYDVFGYSPGGTPRENRVLEIPVCHETNIDKFIEINERFRNLIDSSNIQNKKAIEKNPKLKLEYVTVVGI